MSNMPDINEIKNQIKNLDGVSKLLGRKEIKELPNILWEDEKLEKLIQGFYEKGTGILVATNKRLIFIDKSLLGKLRVEDFPYDKISSIQYQAGLIYGNITIFSSGNKAKIEQLDKKQTRNFADYVRARISGGKEHASAPTPPAEVSSDDVISKLEKLANLKERGILSEEEFLEQKKKILNSK